MFETYCSGTPPEVRLKERGLMRFQRSTGTLAALMLGSALALSLSACSAAKDGPETTAENEISFGLSPAEDAATVLTKFTPFIDYLGESTDLKVDPYVGADYTAVVEALNSGHLDVAWFGPSEYVLATTAVEGGVEAFAAAQQADDTVEYRTVFIVRDDSAIRSPEDFTGATIAFTDPASTSGHIFGRHALAQENIDPEETFAQIIYSGSHDASLLSLVNGQVDVAAISARLMPGFIESGLAAAGDIRVVFESAEIPADPLVFRKDLPEATKQKLRDALLVDDPAIAEHLSETGFASFAEVDDTDYNILREAYITAGLEPEL